MSKTKAPTEKHNNSKSPFSIVNSVFNFVASTALYILGSVLLGTVIEWCGMFFGYWDSMHAPRVFTKEFSYLGDNFSTTIFGQSAKQVTINVIRYFDQLLPDLSNNNFVHGRGLNAKQWLVASGQASSPYFNAFFYILLITIVRCVIICLSSATLIIIAFAAITDGLHQREIRKVSGGTEHGAVYHYAKSWVPKAIIISPVLYLAWPTNINPNYILLPGLLLFYLALYISFATYKKFI